MDGTISDATGGMCGFTLSYQATAVPGQAGCEILASWPDNRTLKAVGLQLDIQPSNLEDAVESSSEFSALVTALNEVKTAADTASQAASDAQQAVTDANGAIDNINAKEQEITTAEDARQTNETDRQTAETSRSSAEQDRADAESSRVSAESSRATEFSTLKSDSQASTTAANTAADRANAAAQSVDDAIQGDIGPAIDSALSQKTDVAGGIAGYDSTQTALTAKSDKSSLVPITLSASGWTGDAAPYSQQISVEGVTATSANEVLPDASITADQLEAFQDANIQDGGQEAGKITLLAFGDKPSIDLPVRVIVRGDL
jgi:myosin heavy subunit